MHTYTCTRTTHTQSTHSLTRRLAGGKKRVISEVKKHDYPTAFIPSTMTTSSSTSSGNLVTNSSRTSPGIFNGGSSSMKKNNSKLTAHQKKTMRDFFSSETTTITMGSSSSNRSRTKPTAGPPSKRIRKWENASKFLYTLHCSMQHVLFIYYVCMLIIYLLRAERWNYVYFMM